MFAKNCARLLLVVVNFPLLAAQFLAKNFLRNTFQNFSWIVHTKNFTTIRCVITDERSSQLLRGGTLKIRKFLLARRHKYHMPIFLVCTTHWRLTNNFYSPNLPHGVHSAPKNQNFWPHMLLSSDFVTGTKIAITWYSNYSHSSRSSTPILSPTKPHTKR